MTEISSFCEKLKKHDGKVIKGKEEIIEKTILCILCGGHILLEDVPGTGKTTLAKTLCKSMDLSFSRIQFTPDLLPSDLTGVHFFDQKKQEFIFRKGPVFTNILLADEINRATPRTQSSLLECMEERQVTVDGETFPLTPPFLVIATQNPVEIQGTFPLPEAQLDRFFMRLSMGYPDPESELSMLESFQSEDPLASLPSVVSSEELLTLQKAVRMVTVGEKVKKYILAIVEETRKDERIRLGVSPRGTLALMRASQACAAIHGRDYVLPDDVKYICKDVLLHRLLCKGSNFLQSSAADDILTQILDRIPVVFGA